MVSTTKSGEAYSVVSGKQGLWNQAPNALLGKNDETAVTGAEEQSGLVTKKDPHVTHDPEKEARLLFVPFLANQQICVCMCLPTGLSRTLCTAISGNTARIDEGPKTKKFHDHQLG